jgi:hypothetical protein
MRRERIGLRLGGVGLLTALLALGSASSAAAQASADTNPSFEIYGFAMLDIGHNFKTIDPNWFDTMRVTKLPSFAGEFGHDDSTFAGVRQTRFGVKSSTPTKAGVLKTQFEFELFGVGVDEGQTTFRLRHAWGELGSIGAGQYWSPFMDPDVFPNSLEYWGPTGMVFFRNVQVRWTPVHSDKNTLMVAAERPGASGDQGVYADRIELAGISPRFPVPDLSGAYKMSGKGGYFRIAGIVRPIKWDDNQQDAFDLSGSATGWGINLSSNLKAKKDVIRLQVVYGDAIQNYMNDSPVDVGIKLNPGNVNKPFDGEAIPIVGIVAFIDHTWNERYSSTFGYSRQDNNNTDGQAPDAFKTGQYALANLLFYPAPDVMMGGEFQWGQRENNSDGFKYDGYKVQFSFRYNFSHKFGG